ncbi:hypothetical protein [Bifidobacterium scaligerum]|uniref:Uncharacterized protein n=1 Tax=Bifidobacterium scaligerum TaxID=2052656 RepID=A0A2M9HSY4_9BIFI|nr:hypothetical protein [Bifidobacterium scaligerum]PJM79920.1 hypothetical protein CUU80_01930 [Bifidobacterium scaligerum]
MVGLVITALVVAAATFAVTFAVGRITKDPTTDQTYLALAAKTKEVEANTAENRKEAKHLTEQRDDLREQVVEQRKQAAEDKKLYRQYVGDAVAGKTALTVNSISPDVDPFYTFIGGEGLDKYYYPKITVKNTSGHVIFNASVDYNVVGTDGKVLVSDENAYVSNVVVYPGKTVVLEGMLKDAGFSGATIRPTSFSVTIPNPKYDNSTTTEKGQFGNDVRTVVIP